MTPHEAFKKALVEGRSRDLETIILRSPEFAYLYARFVIEGRWLQAEELILTDNSGYEERYLTDVLKKDMVLIKSTPLLAANYAVYVMEDRWSEIEPLLLTDGRSMCLYVYGILCRTMDNVWKCDPEAVLRGWIEGKDVLSS